MAKTSSRATTPNKVVVNGPLALYSRIIARIAAGAVAHDIAPMTMAIGKYVWEKLGLAILNFVTKLPKHIINRLTKIHAPSASKGVIVIMCFPNLFSLSILRLPPIK